MILCMKESDTVKWHCLSNYNCVINSFKFCHIHILLKKFNIQLVTNLAYMLVLCHTDFLLCFWMCVHFYHWIRVLCSWEICISYCSSVYFLVSCGYSLLLSMPFSFVMHTHAVRLDECYVFPVLTLFTSYVT